MEPGPRQLWTFTISSDQDQLTVFWPAVTDSKKKKKEGDSEPDWL